jgi:hypothetical protein
MSGFSSALLSLVTYNMRKNSRGQALRWILLMNEVKSELWYCEKDCRSIIHHFLVDDEGMVEVKNNVNPFGQRKRRRERKPKGWRKDVPFDGHYCLGSSTLRENVHLSLLFIFPTMGTCFVVIFYHFWWRFSD